MTYTGYPDTIPEKWIKSYVGGLLAAAAKFEEGPMKQAVLLRAEHAMDLVQAWRDKDKYK